MPLDASKVFDNVEYAHLFTALPNRSICSIVLGLLINTYINLKIKVRWNYLISRQSGISNGVKQGGCLSSTLFSVYIHRLITEIMQSNIGCLQILEFTVILMI